MKIPQESIERLRGLLSGAPQRIVIVSHINPDGDAVGSSLAWREVLLGMGHCVTCVIPNKYPYFLDWMTGIDTIISFRNDEQGVVARAIADADLIFFLDFNSMSRMEDLSELFRVNATAKRILIDHHLTPADEYELVFSYPDSSSTSFLIYSIIEAMLGTAAITRPMAEALYVGMMTDTGNFSFSFLTPALYRAVAVLAETGIDIPAIYNSVYNGYTEGRARLFGYAINRKMEILRGGEVAYMSLLESEMRRYQFQPGDSEGFVNYPLTIKSMKLSAIFISHRKFIRVSLRSSGQVDVDLFARKYFDGGGHHNASGGKSYRSMPETIEHFRRSIEEFSADGFLG
jgi:phosphoesterase RecJ-like protein